MRSVWAVSTSHVEIYNHLLIKQIYHLGYFKFDSGSVGEQF